ncbi:MAG: DUF4411 family protein [Oligoflexia bacterium]|nr:DUF4411 family protein [Oligoflexia bacterium]
MGYLIDANVFIQAKNLQYGFDFCPAFWEWLITENSSGKVFSIERVGDELAAGADDLSVWAQARGSAFFRKPAPTLIPGLGQVSTWERARFVLGPSVSSGAAEGAPHMGSS